MLAYQDFLFVEVESSDLAAYITWELVRCLGPLADQRLSYGTAEASCFEAVYRLMPYPSVLPYMEDLDSYSSWEEAELIFRDVSEAMVSFMKKQGIRLRTTEASFRLRLPTATQLDTFYEELQVEDDDETSEQADVEERPFLHAYLASLSQIRSKELFSIVQADAFYPVPPPRSRQVQLNLRCAQVTQDGESRVPLTWLLPPRFGAHVPPALNYGGFGLELAAALPRGVPLTASWLECLERLEPRLALRGHNDGPARLALAAEVVVAFVDRHLKVGRPILLPGLEEVSEEMLFFVSACAGMCAKNDPEASYRCNLATRNSRLFAQAFNCAEGSYMNPSERIRRISFDAEFMLGRRPNIYWRTCWIILCPLALACACLHKIRTIKTPIFFNVTIPGQYQALAWIIGCAGLLQIPIGSFSSIMENIRFPLRAFQPEYLWEPNTVNRVNAYFEEIEDRDIGVGQESSGAEAPGILYDATEVRDISMDQDEPLAFRPFVG
ncbi:uncharacterized protein LOC144108385 [Amblyomma americanum]